jgi:hypothetical protein
MIRLRGISNELRRARSRVGALGMTACLVAGVALAEGAPSPAAPAAPAPAPNPGKGPDMKHMGGPPGAPGHGPMMRDAKDKPGPGSKEGKDKKGDKEAKGDKPGKDDKEAKGDGPKGPLSPGERAALALERAKERLTQASTQAEAEEGEPDPKTRAQRRAARRAFLRAQHDLRKASGKKWELSPEQKSALKEKLEKRTKELEGTRPKRLSDSQAKVKKSFGQALGHAPIRRELRRHAWRLARLERTKELATASDQKALLERATQLIAAESARHDKRMKQLMDLWKKAGSPKGELPSAAKKAAGDKPATPTAPGAPAPAKPPVAVKPVAPAPTPTPAPAAPEAK